MGVTRKEERKVQVLLAVGQLSQEFGYPPSYRDIGATTGLAHSHVYGLVRELRHDGLIHDRPEKTSRAITLTPDGATRYRHLSDPDSTSESP